MARARIVRYLDAATRCQVSQDRAALFYTVLVRARALATSCHHRLLGEAQRLRASIDQACQEAGLRSEDLGLSFCALVDAHALAGRTVSGSYSVDLDQALAQRRRLLAAKSQGWQQLRKEWVDVMQVAAPARPRTWGHARPRPKGEREAELFADAARSAHVGRAKEVEERAENRSWTLFLRRLAKAVAGVAMLTSMLNKPERHLRTSSKCPLQRS